MCKTVINASVLILNAILITFAGMSKFSIKVNGDYSFEVEQNKDALINQGALLDIDIIEIKAGQFHIIYQKKSYNADLIAHNPDDKTFTIRVNTNNYTLSLKNQYDLLLDKLGMANLNTKKVSEIKAPMPGLVLDIKVSPGQVLKKGDPVLILEAMKMENILKATGEGVVKEIRVKQADAVEKNQVMVTLE